MSGWWGSITKAATKLPTAEESGRPLEVSLQLVPPLVVLKTAPCRRGVHGAGIGRIDRQRTDGVSDKFKDRRQFPGGGRQSRRGLAPARPAGRGLEHPVAGRAHVDRAGRCADLSPAPRQRYRQRRSPADQWTRALQLVTPVYGLEHAVSVLADSVPANVHRAGAVRVG